MTKNINDLQLVQNRGVRILYRKSHFDFDSKILKISKTKQKSYLRDRLSGGVKTSA